MKLMQSFSKDIFTPGARQYIYCGDISASLDSALLPVLSWVLVSASKSSIRIASEGS